MERRISFFQKRAETRKYPVLALTDGLLADTQGGRNLRFGLVLPIQHMNQLLQTPRDMDIPFTVFQE